MTRFLAIAKATALEILSEPLSLLLTLAALVVATLAPAFHYHQFGEASRMARDAGLSALFLCGMLFAIFGILRSLRREIESGTLQMELAHPIPRGAFFLSKVAGAFLAQTVFALIVSATAITIVNGAEIGGVVAKRTGDIARLWGPSLAIGVGTILFPLVVGAVLNRFFRVRFVGCAFRTALLLSLAGVAYRLQGVTVGRMLPACLLVFVFTVVFMTVSAAFAVRFRANVASAATGLLALLSVPAVGNYYLSDALSKGGQIAGGYVALAILAALPAMAAFLLLGIHFFSASDVADRD